MCLTEFTANESRSTFLRAVAWEETTKSELQRKAAYGSQRDRGGVCGERSVLGAGCRVLAARHRAFRRTSFSACQRKPPTLSLRWSCALLWAAVPPKASGLDRIIPPLNAE